MLLMRNFLKKKSRIISRVVPPKVPCGCSFSNKEPTDVNVSYVVEFYSVNSVLPRPWKITSSHCITQKRNSTRRNEWKSYRSWRMRGRETLGKLIIGTTSHSACCIDVDGHLDSQSCTWRGWTVFDNDLQPVFSLSNKFPSSVSRRY